MTCPICEIENPSETKSCVDCGHELTRICSKCETKNMLRANFCINCEKGLEAALHEPEIALIQRVVAPRTPDAIAQKLQATHDLHQMVGL